jgi:serine/threonine-protein kinase
MGENVDIEIGKHHLAERSGSGGMGTVYRATHRLMGKTYAVKLLPDALSDATGFVTRFRDEARVMAELRHPNIVQIHCIGKSRIRQRPRGVRT